MEKIQSQERAVLSVLLKLGVIASCCAGIAQHDLDMSRGFVNSIFMAFTVESNMWIAAICCVYLVNDLATKARLPDWLYTLKFMFTTATLLTWMAFAVLLAPTMNVAYLVSASNVFLHNLTPILALFDFISSDIGHVPNKKHVWYAVVMPALYAVFFFAAYETTGKLPVSYFFLDYRTYGWLSIGPGGIGVGYWIVILLLATLGIGAAVSELKSRARRAPLATSVAAMAVMTTCSVVSGIINVLLH